jgi:HK97 family phage major capsid protein
VIPIPYTNLVTRANVAALVPEQISQAMLTTIGEQSAVLSLGQNIPLASNQVRFPVLSALPTAYFVAGDTGLKQTTEAAWSNKYLYVEEIATIVPIPEAVLDDAGFDVFAAIRPLMETAVVRTLDSAVVFGTNAPTTWATEGNLVGKAVAAGNVVARGTNNAAAGGFHQDILDTVGAVELDGYFPNGAIGNISVRGALRKVRDTTGQQLALPADVPDIAYPGSLAGLWPTGVNAAELLVGDFSQLVVGVRQDMTYKLLDQGVITNASGAIQYNLPQQDMVALRLVFRAGYAVSNPINLQNGTEATRSPFAVLRSPAA